MIQSINVDPITLSVLQNGLMQVCNEMDFDAGRRRLRPARCAAGRGARPRPDARLLPGPGRRSGPRQGDALTSAVVVASPCVSVCAIDARTGWCEGCLRTIDEIAAWGALEARARRDIWKLLPVRREARAAGTRETT